MSSTFLSTPDSSGGYAHTDDVGPPDLVAAMLSEQSGIQRALRRHAGSDAPRVRKLGVGERSAAEWTASLEGRSVPSSLVSMGFACGLQEACELGHVILSQTFLSEREAEVFHGDPQLLEMAAQACQQAGIPYHMGPSFTALKPVLKSTEKESLGIETGAVSSAMEDYWLAKEAHKKGVPFLSARVILDPVSQDLPAAVGKLAFSQGMGMALRLLGQIWRFPLLVRLAFQGTRAQRSLGAFATTFCSMLIPAVRRQSTLSTGGVC